MVGSWYPLEAPPIFELRLEMLTHDEMNDRMIVSVG